MGAKDNYRLQQWTMKGLLLLACTVYFCNGATTNDLKSKIEGGKSLSCYVCNSMTGKCDNVENDKSKQFNCSESYFENVYGNGGIGSNSSDIPLAKWPLSLSELAAKGTEQPMGWTPTNYPSSYDMGKTLVDDETAYRFSSFANLLQNNGTLKLNKGFQTCRTIKIIVESQLNGGNAREISKSEPRIIRGCSFASLEDKTNKEAFDGKGCRVFNYRSATVHVCYCAGDNCNGAPHRKLSIALLTAAAFVFLASKFGTK